MNVRRQVEFLIQITKAEVVRTKDRGKALGIQGRRQEEEKISI